MLFIDRIVPQTPMKLDKYRQAVAAEELHRDRTPSDSSISGYSE
jgi:hypothetical protein